MALINILPITTRIDSKLLLYYGYDAYTIPGAHKIHALQEGIDKAKVDLLVTFPSTKSLWQEPF
ncbi:hypothetical protein [Pontibacter harenae]|uniref:hypothetical protein n=1 Tax=Pontibacter harenae TaxID=2894083 RepID=UPI001E30113D|nr:hypothetical protein [Pontibacter harenae]MCC9169079.1 hypothetical protein [Pontibacter harenae]